MNRIVYAFTENIEKFGYLLSWEDAEKKVGRKLDSYNKFDECVYFDLLLAAIKAAGEEPIVQK